MMNIGNQSEKGLIIDNEDDGEISEKMPSSDSNQSSKQIAEKDEPPNKRTKQDRWIYSTNDDGGNNDGSETQPKQDKKDDDNQSLDEGEIVDDDDEVCLKNQSNSTSKLPIDDDDDDKFEEGECNDQLIKNSNDNDTGKQKDQADEIASNYSDWSESEDDLLKADNTQQESKIDTIQKVDKTTLSVKGKRKRDFFTKF